MASARRGLAALLILALALAWSGCSSGGGNSIDDSQIISALNLKKASSGYEMNGDPFCQIDELLNNVDEVKAAGRKKGSNFVIAAPKGEAGVVARPPFAPACKREAQAGLKKLAHTHKNKQ
jgi:hypothetical protein